eukprot:541712_1
MAACFYLSLLVFLLVILGVPTCCQGNKFGVHLNERIVNGIPSRASQFPYIASLSIAFGGSSSFPRCGGSILRKHYPAIVLTAAHCLMNDHGHKYPISVDLYRDDVHPEQPGDSGQYTHWTSLYTVAHAHFNATTFDNDIGLVFLDANLTNYDQYDEVSIANNITYNKTCCHDKERLTIIGYGYSTHGGAVTDTLEYTTVSFMNRSQCNKQLSEWYINTYNDTANETLWTFATENQICAMGNNTDACQGDSGGPLMKYNTNHQVGIISTGYGCNQNIPGIYTNLGVYYEWIHQQILEYETRMISISTTQIATDTIATQYFMNATDTTENVEVQNVNIQLAIGCSVAGLCLLGCVCLIYGAQHMRQKKQVEKYNRMNEGNQLNQSKDKGKATKSDKEGALDVVQIATNIQVDHEMNSKDTKLIAHASSDVR